MLRWIVGDVPTWLRGDQIALRQERTRYNVVLQGRKRLWRVVRWTLLLVVFLLLAVVIVTEGFQIALGDSATQAVWRLCFAASLILQLLCSAGAVLTLVNGETQDAALRATPQGIGLWVRARWVGGLLRVRSLLVFLYALRLVMLGTLLVELTAFRGQYLDLVAKLEIKPALETPVMVLVMALGVTVALLLPLASVSLDSAVGIWATHVFRERIFALSLQLGWFLMRLLTALGSLWLLERALRFEILLPSDGISVVYYASVMLGEWGASLANLTRSAVVWGLLPGSVIVVVLALGFLLLQVVLSETLLWATVKRVEKAD